MKRKTILLLGSSGWVAHYTIPDLIEGGFKVMVDKVETKFKIEVL